MKRKQRVILSSLMIPGLLMAVSGWFLSQERRQQRLDKDLIAATRRNDAPAVERLLAQGADPDACEGTAESPSLLALLKRLFARRQKQTHQPGVLLLAAQKDYRQVMRLLIDRG